MSRAPQKQINGVEETKNGSADGDAIELNRPTEFVAEPEEPPPFAQRASSLPKRMDSSESNSLCISIDSSDSQLFGDKDDQCPADAERGHRSLAVIIFDMFIAGDFDSSALHILKEILSNYRRQNIQVYFARLYPRQEKALERVGIIRDIGGKEMLFESIHDAILAARAVRRPTEE